MNCYRFFVLYLYIRNAIYIVMIQKHFTTNKSIISLKKCYVHETLHLYNLSTLLTNIYKVLKKWVYVRGKNNIPMNHQTKNEERHMTMFIKQNLVLKDCIGIFLER